MELQWVWTRSVGSVPRASLRRDSQRSIESSRRVCNWHEVSDQRPETKLRLKMRRRGGEPPWREAVSRFPSSPPLAVHCGPGESWWGPRLIRTTCRKEANPQVSSPARPGFSQRRLPVPVTVSPTNTLANHAAFSIWYGVRIGDHRMSSRLEALRLQPRGHRNRRASIRHSSLKLPRRSCWERPAGRIRVPATENAPVCLP